MIGAPKKVSLLIPSWTTPFVVGESRDEASAVLDRLLPHQTFKIVATGVVDYAKSFALKAPFHRD